MAAINGQQVARVEVAGRHLYRHIPGIWRLALAGWQLAAAEMPQSLKALHASESADCAHSANYLGCTVC